MVPFWGTLNIRCRIILGIQERDHNFDNDPYVLGGSLANSSSSGGSYERIPMFWKNSFGMKRERQERKMTAWLRSQLPSLPEDHTGLGFSGLGFRVQDLGFGGVWGFGSSN